MLRRQNRITGIGIDISTTCDRGDLDRASQRLARPKSHCGGISWKSRSIALFHWDKPHLAAYKRVVSLFGAA
jgi:hypothetical protein